MGLKKYWYGIRSVIAHCCSVPFCNTAYAIPLEPYLWIWILQNKEATSTNSRRPPYTCQVAYHSLSSSKYNSHFFFLSCQVGMIVFYTSYPPVLRFQNRPCPYPAAPSLLPSEKHLQKTFAGMPSFSGSGYAYMFLLQADSSGLCLCFKLARTLYMHNTESAASQQDLLSFDLSNCCMRRRAGLDHKHGELP